MKDGYQKIQLRINEVRLACDKILDQVERRYGSELQMSSAFKADHYWELELDASFRLVEQPELHIFAGQTSDDVNEICRLSQLEKGEDNTDIVLGHALEHLAGLLRRIAFFDATR